MKGSACNKVKKLEDTGRWSCREITREALQTSSSFPSLESAQLGVVHWGGIRSGRNQTMSSTKVRACLKEENVILFCSSQHRAKSVVWKKYVNAQKHDGGSRHYYDNINHIKFRDIIGCFRKIYHKRKLIIHINLDMRTWTYMNKSRISKCIPSSSINKTLRFLNVRHKED